MSRKVSVVGGGNVGASAIMYLAEKHLADLVLVDVVEGLPQGKSMDLSHASAYRKYDVTITGSNDYSPIKGSDVVVITAGLPRKPGMSRSDLLEMNAKIVSAVCEQVVRHAPEAVVVIVSNPLDVMCWVAMKVTGFPRERVIGMAGVLDTCRFRYFIAEELGVVPTDVSAMVLGGHGDSMMPLPRYSTVSGIPITELIPEEKIATMVTRAAKGGGEIVELLKTGSAFYAPAASAVEMVEALLTDSKRVLPCSVYLQGEYGIDGVFVGVPVRLGRKGIDKLYELKLEPAELEGLQKSAEAVRADMNALKI